MMFAFQQKSFLCTEGQGAGAFLVKAWLGRRREIFKHETTRKERAPRQDGFLGTGGRSPAGWDHSAGLAFTAAIIISDANDRHTDDRYHSCRSMSLRASRQHPMRSDPGRTAWSPCTDEGEGAEGPPMWPFNLKTTKLNSQQAGGLP